MDVESRTITGVTVLQDTVSVSIRVVSGDGFGRHLGLQDRVPVHVDM